MPGYKGVGGRKYVSKIKVSTPNMYGMPKSEKLRRAKQELDLEKAAKKRKNIYKDKSGLGLGIFIGKTLLEKNFASINCKNSETRSGAEITIKWKNKDLFNL